MAKRLIIWTAVLALLALLGGTSVCAVSYEDIYKESGAAEIAPEEDVGLWESLWQTLTTALTGGAGKAVKSGASVIACLLALFVINGMRSIKTEDISGTAVELAGAAALSALCFPAVYGVFTYTSAAIKSMCTFCTALLPVSGALYSMGGNTAQGISAGAGLSLFLTVAQAVNTHLLLPLLSAGFAFALTGLLPSGGSLAGLGAFLKNACVTLVTFVFSLVGFVFYFQTAVSATSDNLTYRTVKFASGTFIPVIGNAVGDSARTVFGAVSAVKASVGVTGLCVVLGYLLPPMVSAIAYKCAFSLCGVFARLCGLPRQAQFIGELSALLGISLALLVACTVIFTVISAVFLKSGVAV